MPAMILDHVVDEPKKCPIVMSEAATFAIIKYHESILRVE